MKVMKEKLVNSRRAVKHWTPGCFALLLSALVSLRLLYVDRGAEHRVPPKAETHAQRNSVSRRMPNEQGEDLSRGITKDEAIELAEAHLGALGVRHSRGSCAAIAQKINGLWVVTVTWRPEMPGAYALAVLTEGGKLVSIIRGE